MNGCRLDAGLTGIGIPAAVFLVGNIFVALYVGIGAIEEAFSSLSACSILMLRLVVLVELDDEAEGAAATDAMVDRLR